MGVELSFLWGPKAGASFFGTLTPRTIENSHDARLKSGSRASGYQKRQLSGGPGSPATGMDRSLLVRALGDG